MDKEIKKEIANFFLSDSREYLKRYELLKGMQTDITNRSKLLIDIVFSFECSLKALIFIESEEDEKETYKKIRNYGHDLKKLIKYVNTEQISEIISKIDNNIEHLSISSRYVLEANIYFRNSVGILGELYYSTIANFIWLDEMYNRAKDLYHYVDLKIDNSLQIKNFNEIDIERELDIAKRLKQLGKKNYSS